MFKPVLMQCPVFLAMLKVWQWDKNHRFTVNREKGIACTNICYIMKLYVLYWKLCSELTDSMAKVF